MRRCACESRAHETRFLQMIAVVLTSRLGYTPPKVSRNGLELAFSHAPPWGQRAWVKRHPKFCRPAVHGRLFLRMPLLCRVRSRRAMRLRVTDEHTPSLQTLRPVAAFQSMRW